MPVIPAARQQRGVGIDAFVDQAFVDGSNAQSSFQYPLFCPPTTYNVPLFASPTAANSLRAPGIAGALLHAPRGNGADVADMPIDGEGAGNGSTALLSANANAVG